MAMIPCRSRRTAPSSAPGAAPTTGACTRNRPRLTSGVIRGRPSRMSGTGSIHTVCQMPVVRVYMQP